MNAGSPTDLSAVSESVTLLQIWFPDEDGAEALADAIFGVSPPAGRLPTTFPANLRDTSAGSIGKDNPEIALSITNAGSRPWVEVVQVYAHFLDPGEARSLVVPLDAANLMYPNPTTGAWDLDTCTVELRIAHHSRDAETVIAVNI